MNNLVYLDNAATTKPLISSLEQADVYNKQLFFNPSAKYRGGMKASNEVKTARTTLERLFSSDFDVIFTSCGSESDNTAIFSYARRGNAVTSQGEHSAVYEPFLQLKQQGVETRFASLNLDGSVNVDDLLSLIDSKTTFVSIVHVNNETGAINDINLIADKIKKINPNVIFHSDGVQAFGKIPFRPSKNIDLYSISAHKIGAVKGVGALFKNKKLNNLKPLIYGGGQEFGLRSGTENVFGIKMLEFSAKTKYENITKNYAYVKELKNAFLSSLDKSGLTIISSENASPYVISISANGLRGEILQHLLEDDGVIIGTGSACSSKNPYSRVIKAIGYNNNVLSGVVRISFCSENTLNDAVLCANLINKHVKNLKDKIL